jgi:hypothetical protein
MVTPELDTLIDEVGEPGKLLFESPVTVHVIPFAAVIENDPFSVPPLHPPADPRF